MLMRKLRRMHLEFLSQFFFICGILSIVGSAMAWVASAITGPGITQIQREEVERFSLFIGLWAPTLLILSIHIKFSLMSKK